VGVIVSEGYVRSEFECGIRLDRRPGIVRKMLRKCTSNYMTTL
jgi:hypothetical protein